MDLSQFRAVAKPRNVWQTLDLGIVFARASFWKLFLTWLIPSALMYAFLSIFMWDEPGLIMFVLWWLKPAWEKPLLYIMSRKIFADKVTWQYIFKNYWKIIKPQLFLQLTWRRFSPSRTFDLPVSSLEQLKGSVRRKRLGALHRRFYDGALWLQIVGLHVETFLVMGAAGAAYLLLPQGVELNFEDWLYGREVLEWHIYYSAWLVAMGLVAPLYVCSGFALYLQRRVDLEGWDIEICFRNLVERKKKKEFGLKGVLSIAFIFVLSFGNVVDAKVTTKEVALDSVHISPERKQAKEEILEIIRSDEYINIEERKGWRFKEKEEEEDEEPKLVPDWMIDFAEWLSDKGKFFSWIADFFKTGAALTELLIWVLVISLVLYFIVRYRHLVKDLLDDGSSLDAIEVKPPKVLFGLEVTKESLPDDVVAQAREHWVKGEERQALGMLLRSSIIKLLYDYKYPFEEGNTENECAQIVEHLGKEQLVRFFWGLTKNWQKVAYAHQRCDGDVFNELCEGWEREFAREV